MPYYDVSTLFCWYEIVFITKQHKIGERGPLTDMKSRVILSLFLFEYQIKYIVILIFRLKIIIFVYFILKILIILIFIIIPITKLNKWQTPFTFMVCFDQTAIYKISNVDIIGPLPVKHNYPSEYHQKISWSAKVIWLVRKQRRWNL